MKKGGKRGQGSREDEEPCGGGFRPDGQNPHCSVRRITFGSSSFLFLLLSFSSCSCFFLFSVVVLLHGGLPVLLLLGRLRCLASSCPFLGLLGLCSLTFAANVLAWPLSMIFFSLFFSFSLFLLSFFSLSPFLSLFVLSPFLSLFFFFFFVLVFPSSFALMIQGGYPYAQV